MVHKSRNHMHINDAAWNYSEWDSLEAGQEQKNSNQSAFHVYKSMISCSHSNGGANQPFLGSVPNYGDDIG